MSTHTSPLPRWLLSGLTLGLALWALAACGILGDSPLPPITVSVTAQSDFTFAPSTLIVQVNQPITFTVQNETTLPLSVTLDDLKVRIENIPPGQSGVAVFTPTQVHTYTDGGAQIFQGRVAGRSDVVLKGNLIVNP